MDQKKEFKTEALKNMVANRFQLNFKRNVGPTSLSIRQAQPGSLQEWERYYYEHVRPHSHIQELGEIMHGKIHEEVIPALESISIEECCQYMHDLVIAKTYQGYLDEIQAVNDLLQSDLAGVDIEPACDEWDRTLAVDFFIRVGGSLLGLQIKPITAEQVPELHKWEALWEQGHRQFEENFGGRVFTVYLAKSGQQKELHNPEVIEEIRQEIVRLQDGE